MQLSDKKRFILIFLFLTIFVCVEGCHSLPLRLPKQKDGKWYGVTTGSFRHRWWNYYERALSFAEGGFLEEAELDLKMAIRQRGDDKWRARTYGMHFVNYFPHCELGVIRYKQGDLETTIRELETALETAKNAKAEFYLDLARKDQIKANGGDEHHPEIVIRSPESPSLTKEVSILIHGLAKDNTFVRHISVNGENVRVDVSKKEIDFKIQVLLRPGLNQIPIVAKDLTGNSFTKEVVVNVDRNGPVITVDELVQVSDTSFVLNGAAFDPSGISELTINGQKFAYQGKKAIHFQKTVQLQPGQKQVEAVAKDQVGNDTSAMIGGDEMNMANRATLLAENTAGSGESVLPGRTRMLAQPGNLPEIRLSNPNLERLTYLDYAPISGKVTGDIKYLRFNDLDILEAPRKICYFTRLVPLKKDEEAVTIVNIEAIATSGYAHSKQIRIRWREPDAMKPESRLKVAVRDFKNIGKNQDPVTAFEDYLVRAMRIQKRFRNPQVLALPEDEDAACEKAKGRGYDCILLGRVTVTEDDSAHIYAWLKSTDKGETIIENIDIYDNDINSIEKVESLSEAMNYKLTDELPLLKGGVEEVRRKGIVVNIGKERKAREGMWLLVYENSNGETLGQARIRSVEEKISGAELLGNGSDKTIEKGDFVVTR